MNYKEIDGDLIALALIGSFDVITHGCNIHCTQKSGIARQMVDTFSTDTYYWEQTQFVGDRYKLGKIEARSCLVGEGNKSTVLQVVNAYTQPTFGKTGCHVDYNALRQCLRTLNSVFAGRRVGMPTIGAGLGGGDWFTIKQIIQQELTDCDVTVVIYKP